MATNGTTLTTKLKIANWDESPIKELGDAGKINRASVALADGEDGLSAGGFEAVMYYRPDGTSQYSAVMYLEGELAGRRGSFVLAGEGSFDGTTAQSVNHIIPGSGTDALTGITGECTSAST